MTVYISPANEEDRKLAFDCYQTFEGTGDWWTCHVLRLVAKADHANRAKFVLSPWEREALMYDQWVKMNPAAFARKWGIPHTNEEAPIADRMELPDDIPATGFDRAAGIEELDDDDYPEAT